MGLISWLFGIKTSVTEKAAEQRWTENNRRAFLKGCPCGKPATISKDDYTVVGSVPYKWWTCDEHYGAASFFGNTALWERSSPCDKCPLDPNLTEKQKLEPSRHRPCHGSGEIGKPLTRWNCSDK